MNNSNFNQQQLPPVGFKIVTRPRRDGGTEQYLRKDFGYETESSSSWIMYLIFIVLLGFGLLLLLGEKGNSEQAKVEQSVKKKY